MQRLKSRSPAGNREGIRTRTASHKDIADGYGKCCKDFIFLTKAAETVTKVCLGACVLAVSRLLFREPNPNEKSVFQEVYGCSHACDRVSPPFSWLLT